MEPDTELSFLAVEVTHKEAAALEKYSESVSRGKIPMLKFIPPLLVVGLIVVALGCAFAMFYYITYPRTSVKTLKLYNETCAPVTAECDNSRGLYCPDGQCICQLDGSYFDGDSCVCRNLTIPAGGACVVYPSYGQPCSLPTIPCQQNFTCSSSGYCDCNSVTQFFNGTICVSQYTYNQSCSQTAQCANSSNLQCINYLCKCGTDSYWDGSTCAPKILGWQRCNNLTSGPLALPCDDTLGLSCSSNFTCQCLNTMYWDINDQICERKRLYTDACDGDFYCNETLNFICPTVPGTCNCPVWSSDYTCDCRPNWFYDGTRCIPRKSINGTCPGTYACDGNTLLVCFAGLCVCPTPLSWSVSDCVCPSGQTWTGSTCVSSG